MTFLGAPLGTLLGAGAAVATSLVALYLLRPQRRRVDVPYARLWGLVVREARSSAIARRLRRWESLLLQLVIAALILLALSDPRIGERGASRHVILVDVSASMQAVDAGSPRIDRARTAVQHLLDGLSPDEEALLVAFDTQPHALSSLTHDDGELRAAALRIVATDAPDDPLPALRLAADVLRGATKARLTIVTDGALDASRLANVSFGDGADQLPLANVDVRAVVVAAPSTDESNAAITGFSVRRYPANPSAYEILVDMRSYASAPRHGTLTITQEGETVEVTPVELPPGQPVLRRITDLAGEGRRLEAVLKIDGRDDLALDDHAYALLPDRPRTHVLLVGAADLYTEGALLLDRAVEVERVTPAAYDATKAKGYDAAVFAGWTPPSPTSIPTLYLGCDGAGCPFAARGTMDGPIVTEWDKESPVLRWVTFKDLNVSRSSIFALEAGDTSLASSLGRPLLVAGTRNGARAIALGFAPSVSDLPLRVAFPVLLVNSLRWLTGHGQESTDDVRTGRRAQLQAATDLSLDGPEHVDAPARAGIAELTLRRQGVYSTKEGRLVAANLGDARESSIASRPLVLAGETLVAPSLSQRLSPRASPWRWLAAFALLLVAIEWWTFHRRHTV